MVPNIRGLGEYGDLPVNVDLSPLDVNFTSVCIELDTGFFRFSQRISESPVSLVVGNNIVRILPNASPKALSVLSLGII
jgi:hypothetical protein